MRKLILTTITGLIMSTFLVSLSFSQEMSATNILKKADSVVTAYKDLKSSMKTILIDKANNEKVREAETIEKGTDKRLIRFLSPADQKGIGFLTLPNDVQYVYLPAFHKTRRIASSAKNSSFAGTDFSYEDLTTFEYSKDYNPKLLETTKDAYVLELTPKPNTKKEYSKMKMWIRKDNFYPFKSESYDKNGNLWKVMERRKIEKFGNYWFSKELEMRDVKVNHTTKMISEKLEFDTGLSDDLFTERNLCRVK